MIRGQFKWPGQEPKYPPWYEIVERLTILACLAWLSFVAYVAYKLLPHGL